MFFLVNGILKLVLCLFRLFFDDFLSLLRVVVLLEGTAFFRLFNVHFYSSIKLSFFKVPINYSLLDILEIYVFIFIEYLFDFGNFQNLFLVTSKFRLGTSFLEFVRCRLILRRFFSIKWRVIRMKKRLLGRVVWFFWLECRVENRGLLFHIVKYYSYVTRHK